MISTHMVAKTVTNEDYSKLVLNRTSLKNGPWVAGGSVRKVWFGEPWQNQDIDFFFANREQYGAFCAGIAGTDLRTTVQTENATTYYFHDGTKIQAINKQFYANFSDLLESFDFTLAQFVTDGYIMLATLDAIADCKDKKIRTSKNYTQKVKPLRVLKYAAYGFDPDPKILKEGIKALQEGDLSGTDY